MQRLKGAAPGADHHDVDQPSTRAPARSQHPLQGPDGSSDRGLPAPVGRSDAGVELAAYLRALVALGGSDLHCKVGGPPRVRIDGRLRRLDAPELTPDLTEAMVTAILRPDLVEHFRSTNEADFGYSLAGVGRFRVNAYRARGSAGLVVRRVAQGATPLADLDLPDAVGALALEPRGLVLVTGPTGSGKTTTLASMVDHINTLREVHVVTIEDPIEVLHQDKLAIINQREVRVDTEDFSVALRAAMRQDPDVVLVGEMRDAETVRAALSAAETGHLVLSTLHTTDAPETIARIVDFFPPHEQQQVRLSLAASLRGVVAQRLAPRADGTGRAAVMEILVSTPRVAAAIADPALSGDLHALVADGGFYGMQTFDQHLLQMVEDKTVSVEAAKAASTHPHDLTVAMRAAGLVP